MPVFSNKELGNFGETQACKYLESIGYKVIQRNYRCMFGEIDIIAIKDRGIFFIEVKTRESLRYGDPAEAINNKKIKKLTKIANNYLSENNTGDLEIFIEAILLFKDKGKIILRHIKDIF